MEGTGAERSGGNRLSAFSRRRGGFWPTVLALAGVVFLIVTVILSYRLHDYVQELTAAPRDNARWNLTQLEVELLRLKSAADDLDAQSDPDVFRRRYDIFYSRAHIVLEGGMFSALVHNLPIGQNLAMIERFLFETTPIVDGPDAALRQAAPTIAAKLMELQEPTRLLVVGAVEVFAEITERKRNEFQSVLRVTSIVLLGFFASLAIAAIILTGLFRQTLARGREVARGRERLAKAIEVSLEAIVLADSKGRIIEYNKAAEQVFGFPRDEAIGASMTELLTPERHRGDHAAGWSLPAGDAAGGGGSIVGLGRVEATALRSDGSEFPAELSIGAAPDEAGQMYIACIRDISDRLETERVLTDARDRALAADRAKSEFIAVISHEMRTPLNGLLAVLDLLQDSSPDPRQARFLSMAMRSGDLLLRHVNDVLDIARFESGRMDLVSAQVNFQALADEVLELAHPAAAASGALIDVHVAAPDRAVLGDVHRLRQVLLNLVGNAVKFSGNAPIRLAIETLAEDGEGADLEFSVSDAGPGIDPAQHERIFEDFVMIDAGYSRTNAGSGLGLSICRRIVSAMGGEIGVESALGEGSRFWFRVRLAAATGERLAARAVVGDPSPQEERSGPLSILLVEDNPAVAEVVGEMTALLGHRFDCASNGYEGVRKANANAYDLILMDISMPGMDGLEATMTIRAGEGASKAAPIVALTAHAMPEERARFLAAGMQDSLTKPIRKDLLEHAFAMVGRFSAGLASTFSVRRAPPPADPQELIDEDVWSEFAGTMPPVRLATMISAFGAELESVLGLIEEGSVGADQLSAVHRLAGSAAMFGAARLYRALQRFEADAEADIATAMRRLEELRSAAADTMEILNELVEQPAEAIV